MTFDAFISYRRADGGRAASRLRRWLLDYRLPTDLADNSTSPLTVYQDTVYERASEDFYAREIQPALLASRVLIVIATPSALLPRNDGSANWMVREIEDFLAIEPKRPIVVGVAHANQELDLPASLGVKYPNIERVDISGLCGLRRYRVSTRIELDEQLLKFVATLYDIPAARMPLLRREEAKRRTRRLWTVAMSAAGASLIFAGMLVAALVSQVDARQAEWDATASYVQSQNRLADALAASAANARTSGDELSALRLLSAAREAGISPTVTAQTLLTSAPLATFERTLQGTSAWHIAFDSSTLISSAFDGSVGFHDAAPPHHRTLVLLSGAPVVDVAVVGRRRYLVVRRIPADAVWNFSPGEPNSSELLFVHASPAGDTVVRSIPAPSSSARFLSVAAPANAQIAVVGTDVGVFVLSLRDYQLRGPLPEPNEGLLHGASVAVTSDGEFAAASTREGRVRMWDLGRRRFVGAVGARPTGQFAYTRVRMQFKPGGHTLAFGTFSGSVALWEPGTSADRVRYIPLHTLPVASVTWSPDGQMIAAGSYDGTVTLSSSQTGMVLSRLSNTSPGTARVALDLAFSADGRWLAMNSVAPVSTGDRPGDWLYGAVRLWAIHANAPAIAFDEGVHGIAFDKKGYLTAWSERSVDAVDERPVSKTQPCVAGPALTRLARMQRGQGDVRAVDDNFGESDARGMVAAPFLAEGSEVVGPSALSRDGRTMAYLTARATATGGVLSDIRLQICRLTSAERIASVQLADTASDLGPLAFLPNDNAVLAGVHWGSMSRVHVWEAASGKSRLIALPDSHQIRDASPLTPTMLAVADGYGNSGFLDLTSDTLIMAPGGLCCEVAHVSGLSASSSFVSATDAQLRLHTLRDGRHTVVEGSVPVGFRPTSVDATPANGLIVVGEADGSVSIWEGTSLILLARRRACGSPVYVVRASPDGRSLATLCRDGVRLLGRFVPDDTRTAERLSRLTVVEGSTQPLTASEEDALVTRIRQGVPTAPDSAAAQFWSLFDGQVAKRPERWTEWLLRRRGASNVALNAWLAAHPEHPLVTAMHLRR